MMSIEIVKPTLADVSVNFRIGTPARANAIVSMHFHEEVELLFCRTGAMLVDLITEQVLLRPGDILFINARTPHKTVTQAMDTVISLLQFDLRRFHAAASGCKLRHLSAFFENKYQAFVLLRRGEPVGKELLRCYRQMKRELLQKETAYSHYIQAYVYLIAAALSRHKILAVPENRFDATAMQRLEPLFLYIDKNFSRPIPLAELSDLLHVNASYLCRLFKKTTGSTLSNYIKFVRLYEASNLLVSTDQSITNIALSVGFSEASYFDRIFRQYNGCSPSAYRKFKYISVADRHES